MPRSRPKRSSAPSTPRARGARGGSKPSRWQTLGLFVTLLAVAALVGSLAWGVWEHFHAPPAAVPEAAPQTRRADAPAGRVRVQVLNATPTHGLAREATRLLRDGGFDVVETGNAPRGTPPVSTVIDRVGDLRSARQAADALGITQVVTRRDASLLVEVTVVLGSDWRAPAAP
jgi:hypothetical protein